MKINPIADCKNFGFTRSNKKRKIKVEINLNNHFYGDGKVDRVFFFYITLCRKDLDSSIFFHTEQHPIKESIFQSKDRALKFAGEAMQSLIDAFLKQRDYYEEIRRIDSEYTIDFIGGADFELYNNTLFYKEYNYPSGLPLKIKPHNLRWLLQDIFNFKEIDLSKRALLSIFFIADDMFESLGISKDYHTEDIQYLHIQLKNDKTQYQDCIPGSIIAFRRKNDGQNMFVIKESIKDAFQKDFAKFALMKRKAHINIKIDADYNILQATIRH